MNYLETLYEPDSADGSEFFLALISVWGFLVTFYLWLTSLNKAEIELRFECDKVRIDLYHRIKNIAPNILYVHEEFGDDNLKSWLYVYLVEDEPYTFLFDGWHDGYIARITVEAQKSEGLHVFLTTDGLDFKETLYGSTLQEMDSIVAHVQELLREQQTKRTSVHILSLVR